MTAARLAPAAKRDVIDATRWIAKDSPPVARAFVDAVAKATLMIGTHEKVGVVRTELADHPYRFLVLVGFPYVVLYNAALKPPLILRVLHGARDLPELLGDMR